MSFNITGYKVGNNGNKFSFDINLSNEPTPEDYKAIIEAIDTINDILLSRYFAIVKNDGKS